MQIDNVLVMRNESETIVNKEVDEYDYKENEWVFKLLSLIHIWSVMVNVKKIKLSSKIG